MAAPGIKTTINLSHLERYVDRLEVRLVPMVLEQVAIFLSGDMAREAPVKTGRLQGAVDFPVQASDKEFWIDIGVDYWEAVQFGSGIHGPTGQPYEIKPKNKKALAFVVDGQRIVVARVKAHPGRRADPFIDRAIDNIDNNLDSVADQVLRSLE